MALHHHTAAERRILRIQRRQGAAVLRRQQLRDHGAAVEVQRYAKCRPVHRGQALRKTLHRPRAHCVASRASKARLRSTPQR